jgi:hypothetical protein
VRFQVASISGRFSFLYVCTSTASQGSHLESRADVSISLSLRSVCDFRSLLRLWAVTQNQHTGWRHSSHQCVGSESAPSHPFPHATYAAGACACGVCVGIRESTPLHPFAYPFLLAGDAVFTTACPSVCEPFTAAGSRICEHIGSSRERIISVSSMP